MADMIPRTQKVKLGDLTFKVDYSKSKKQLDDKYPWEEGDTDKTTLGVFDADEQKIYIASDIGRLRQLRTLVHEVAEGINEISELELEDNHTKIVSLENMLISFVMNNKALIRKMWKEFDGGTSN